MREPLANRRSSETLAFEFDGMPWTVTWSRYTDGRLAEIFLTGPTKAGASQRIAANDAAIVVSMALQHGVSADKLRSATMRSSSGEPAGVVARALDLVEGGE